MADRSDSDLRLPRTTIERITAPIMRFMHIEAASGIVLIVATAAALILANSPLAKSFLAIWKTEVGFRLGSFEMMHSIKHWINDGLMGIFFFVVGLEVKREMVRGELKNPRRASLPIAAALGGMIVPAAIYLVFQSGEPGARGWGIPMATDIAFVVGCMAVLGSRIPHILRITLLSLAIVDDIGAILVIAIGYTTDLSLVMLVWGIVGLAVVSLAARIGIRSIAIYVMLGALVWFCFHESGVHATIAGVILGLMTPADPYLEQTFVGRVFQRAGDVLHGDWDVDAHSKVAGVRRVQHMTREAVSPLEYLENLLHPWVGFVIMPIFALANAGVPFNVSDFGDPVAIAVMAGLVLGKPLGIMIFSWPTIRFVLGGLPQGLTWGGLFGGACLAGIGFTMALFIAGLALDGDLLNSAKVGILGASMIAAVLGMLILVSRLKPAAST